MAKPVKKIYKSLFEPKLMTIARNQDLKCSFYAFEIKEDHGRTGESKGGLGYSINSGTLKCVNLDSQEE